MTWLTRPPLLIVVLALLSHAVLLGPNPGAVIQVEFETCLVATLKLVDGRQFKIGGAEAYRIKSWEVDHEDQNGSSPEKA